MRKILSVVLSVIITSTFFASAFAAEDNVSDSKLPEYSFDANGLTVDESNINCGDESEIYAAAVHRQHYPLTTKVTPQNINDSKKHRVTYTCKVCYQQYTKDVSHNFRYRAEQNGNDNVYHNYVKYCSTCGYVAGVSRKIKHSFNKGTCRNCGYQNTAKVYKGSGECAAYLAKPLWDAHIYANCPSCGSYSATTIGKKSMRKNQPIAGGRRITIYHQKARCNSCGKVYWNKCYHE